MKQALTNALYHFLLQDLGINKFTPRLISELANHQDMDLPQKGIYFIFDLNEYRSSDNQNGKRIVRIGIVKDKDQSLKQRLLYHANGPDNCSAFRRKATEAYTNAGLPPNTNVYIQKMAFVVLDIPLGQYELRSWFEKGCTRLLSNYQLSHHNIPIDPLSKGWLGKNCNDIKVQRGELWSSHHMKHEIPHNGLGLIIEMTNAANIMAPYLWPNPVDLN